MKQSYHNRCYLLTAQGVHKLIVPIERRRGAHLYKDVKISYSMPWVQQHLRTFVAAYGQTPYYDVLTDLISPVLRKRPRFLFDLNAALLQCFFNFLQMEKSIITSHDFKGMPGGDVVDLRYRFHPKRAPEELSIAPLDYPQRFGPYWSPQLSSFDLLCSQGPYLHELFRKSEV